MSGCHCVFASWIPKCLREQASTVCLLPLFWTLALFLGSGACTPPAARAVAPGVSGEVVPGEYVVGFDDADPASVAAAATLELRNVRDSIAIFIDVHRRSVTEVVDILESLPGVAWAEPERRILVRSRPNDWNADLWGLENEGERGGARDADVGAFAAWEIARGKEQVVAVIDTGLDVDNPDFDGALWINTNEIPDNGVDDDENGYVDDIYGWDFVQNDPVPDDVDGHGTHVAGTVGARADDATGVPGLAYESRLMILKFIEGERGGHSSNGAAAIRYAVDNGADIVNLSWGSAGYSWSIRSAIAYANSKEVLVVAAAGNEGTDNDTAPFYPASYALPNLLAVAASDRKDRLALFSNTGRKSVHLAAPGVEIVSAWLDSRWIYSSGTSMAAPHVAAAAAILLEAAPTASLKQVRSALLDSVTPLARGQDREALVTGGRLRVDDALDLLLHEVSPPDASPPDAPSGNAQPTGTLVITEVLQNPGGSDAGREWFEVFNPDDEPVDLYGWTIKDDDVDTHKIEVHVSVSAHGYAVLAASTDVPEAIYSWGGGLALANGRDELLLLDGNDTLVDRVAWDDGRTFPDPSGASMSLDPAWLTAEGNDDGSAWCVSAASAGPDGDRATPGRANPSCEAG